MTPAPTSAPAAPGQAEPANVAAARDFGEPILAAIAARPPDYEDDFSDQTSGWPVGWYDGTDKWNYDGGAYWFIASYLPQGDCCLGSAMPGDHIFSDFVLQVDTRFVSGTQGIVLVLFRNDRRSGPPIPAYGVRVSSEGDVMLHKNLTGEHINLLSVHAPALHQGFGGEANRITLVVRGDTIAVFANGEAVCLLVDELLSEGDISLGAENRQSDTTLEVSFDNLRVWDISNLTP